MKPRAVVLPRLPDDDDKYDTRQAATFVGLRPRTMEKLRRIGGGPRYLALSRRRVVYAKGALREWLAARERSSTSDPGPPRAA
jgi:hypothetical protein